MALRIYMRAYVGRWFDRTLRFLIAACWSMVDLKLLVNNLHPSSESSRVRQDLRLLSATLSRNSVLLIFFVNYTQ